MQFSLNAQQKQSGFTLVELIMVLVIMVIVSSFALPKMNDMSGSAKVTVTKSALASAKSALDSVYQQAFIENVSNTISLGGQDVELAFGYPADLSTAGAWLELSGFEIVTVLKDNVDVPIRISMISDANCYFDYTRASEGQVTGSGGVDTTVVIPASFGDVNSTCGD